MFTWTFKLLSISALILGALGINKAYKYSNDYSKNIRDKKLEEHQSNTKKLKRIHIFPSGFISRDQLNPLIKYSKSYGEVSINIDEDQLEKSLKPLIKEEMEKLFKKQGWNFHELKGKFYYEIKDKEIELIVIWKNNSYSPEYSHYDHFSIEFRP